MSELAADAELLMSYIPARTSAHAALIRLYQAALAATSPAATAGLDAAWAEAEAALPEGWRLNEVFLHDDGSAWSAGAENTTGVGRYRWVEQGPTPAAALRALAEKLREEGR